MSPHDTQVSVQYLPKTQPQQVSNPRSQQGFSRVLEEAQDKLDTSDSLRSNSSLDESKIALPTADSSRRPEPENKLDKNSSIGRKANSKAPADSKKTPAIADSGEKGQGNLSEPSNVERLKESAVDSKEPPLDQPTPAGTPEEKHQPLTEISVPLLGDLSPRQVLPTEEKLSSSEATKTGVLTIQEPHFAVSLPSSEPKAENKIGLITSEVAPLLPPDQTLLFFSQPTEPTFPSTTSQQNGKEVPTGVDGQSLESKQDVAEFGVELPLNATAEAVPITAKSASQKVAIETVKTVEALPISSGILTEKIVVSTQPRELPAIQTAVTVSPNSLKGSEIGGSHDGARTIPDTNTSTPELVPKSNSPVIGLLLRTVEPKEVKTPQSFNPENDIPKVQKEQVSGEVFKVVNDPRRPDLVSPSQQQPSLLKDEIPQASPVAALAQDNLLNTRSESPEMLNDQNRQETPQEGQSSGKTFLPADKKSFIEVAYPSGIEDLAAPSAHRSSELPPSTVSAPVHPTIPGDHLPQPRVLQSSLVPQSFTLWSQVDKANVISQLIEKVHLIAGKDNGELTVSLKPDFLGRIHLTASMVDKALVATIVTESATVRSLLQSQIPSLQRALQEQGLPAAKVEVIQGNGLYFTNFSQSQAHSHQNRRSGMFQSLARMDFTEHRETEKGDVLSPTLYIPSSSRSINLLA